MNQKLSLLGVLCVLSTLMYAQNGNVGINTTTPQTTLDVNGAITNRETVVAVSGNAATVPSNVSQVRLTGAATAAVAITAPAAPNAGQRLIIYNNTTGGFGATLNGFTITNGQAMEFTYSNGGWRATNGGASFGSNWMLTGNSGTSPSTNFLGTTDNQDMVIRTNNTEKMRVQAGGNVGIGTSAPASTLNVVNAGTGGNVVSTTGTANTVLRLENPGNGQAVIQNLTAKNPSGTAVSAAMGINPNVGTNGILLLTKSNSADFVVDLASGNIGMGTSTPVSTLNVANAGTAGASVSTGIAANTALRLENPGSGQSVIQNLTAKNASGTAISAAMGINPNFSTNGIFLITKSSTSDFVMDLGTGNIGLGTASPTAMLDVNGTARVRSLPATPSATFSKPIMSDASGNLMSTYFQNDGSMAGVTSPSIAAGARVAAMTGIPTAAIYKVSILVFDNCTDVGYVEFFVRCAGQVTYSALQGITGFLGSNGTQTPQFTETQTTSSVVFPTYPGTCPGSAGTTDFNFKVEIDLVAPHTIYITNNGGMAKNYTVRLERIAYAP
ncbi:hypothetical protein SAMN05880574_1412 [Chryseobacterium sp. RU37D]|uniref:hypothetical protein n=1 Tax=Chryseobacterium sp. RU37D TaxID=1907397 RepID=UPI000956A195|nr:hypothetical protein [Chryseobacterium sp. RU37D]SIQ96803.1 hypothetical protein SAMN05880574_1412 [Chryseobacterium sp. RU37D]